jgi:hypothetical protein
MLKDEATNKAAASDSAEFQWRLEQAETERKEIEESKRQFSESEKFASQQREKAKKRGAADRSFAIAAEFAKNQIKSSGLDGEVLPYNEIRYTVAQGLKAAIHGREEVAATFVLQRDILIRLDAIKALLWVAVGILAYIAYKVT